MKQRFEWSTEKNLSLFEQRGISFETVVSSIEQDAMLDVYDHPNQHRYPGQRIYVVEIDGYAYVVPFVVQDDGSRFLKTIIPSRKATQEYLRRNQGE